MTAGPNTILVTGGAGFIGQALVRRLLRQNKHRVLVVDKLTYAANREVPQEVGSHPKGHFVRADIADQDAIREILTTHRPDAIVNLAAETHVDRSIDGPSAFIKTNIDGTFVLLEAFRQYLQSVSPSKGSQSRFLHVSTDEVFGALGPMGRFDEMSRYKPTSPYAASKAASDHMARAWYQTYGLPVIVTNCSNNYGPSQFPEKLIPLMIAKALRGEPMPIYGRGDQVRDWLHVDDHASALEHVLDHGEVGETYCISAECELRNLSVVQRLCDVLDEISPSKQYETYRDLICHVEDRPGHDKRYALDSAYLRDQLGWRPRIDFSVGLRETAEWYLANSQWWNRMLADQYRGERLGLGASKSVA